MLIIFIGLSKCRKTSNKSSQKDNKLTRDKLREQKWNEMKDDTTLNCYSCLSRYGDFIPSIRCHLHGNLVP